MCSHNMFEEINAGFQQLFQGFKKSTLLREREREKGVRETGTSKDQKEMKNMTFAQEWPWLP